MSKLKYKAWRFQSESESKIVWDMIRDWIKEHHRDGSSLYRFWHGGESQWYVLFMTEGDKCPEVNSQMAEERELDEDTLMAFVTKRVLAYLSGKRSGKSFWESHTPTVVRFYRGE